MDMTTDNKQERRLALWFLLVALLALLVGALPGVMQALEHAGWFPVPSAAIYYQGLSLHGVLTALVWTSFFASAFLMIATSRSLGRGLSVPALSWLAFLLMVVGAGLMVFGALVGPTVLYTIDLPLVANPLYYVGFLLLILGTWLHSINHFMTWGAWKRDNPDARTPLAAYGAVAAWLLWDIATLGVVVELILILINASAVSPLLGRTLFWYFGNGLHTFALLPAYVSWLAMMPRQAGGKLYSERMARAVFVLFLIFTVPSGIVQQITDGALAPSLKALHVGLAFFAAVPVLITAFVTMASLEYAGASRGSRGLIGWVFRLPWADASFVAQILALTALAGAGITGLINISYSMALVVDNTTWEVGHLHLTLGTAGALTFMGITYWLLPYLIGRRLMSRALATMQVWLWFLGALVFVQGMNVAGLMDAPRRTPFSLASYTQTLIDSTASEPMGGFQIAMMLVAVGGVMMALSAAVYFLIMAGTLVAPKETDAPVDVPLADTLDAPASIPAGVDDRWKVWIGAAVVLILLSYMPTLIGLMR